MMMITLLPLDCGANNTIHDSTHSISSIWEQETEKLVEAVARGCIASSLVVERPVLHGQGASQKHKRGLCTRKTREGGGGCDCHG